jgi:hypothetical protein
LPGADVPVDRVSQHRALQRDRHDPLVFERAREPHREAVVEQSASACEQLCGLDPLGDVAGQLDLLIGEQEAPERRDEPLLGEQLKQSR